MRVSLLAVGVLLTGCYEAPRAEEACTITCTDDCPSGLTCQNGFCVGDGETCAPEFVQISTGGGFACAIDSNRDLWCWGSNEHHQIDAGEQLQYPLATRVGTERWEMISAGRGHACGIVDGRILCWGANDRDQITSAIQGEVEEPVEIELTGGPDRWSVVAAGWNTTCAIGDGRLYCWGANNLGQLGIGSTIDVGSPTPVASELEDWKAVSHGWGRTDYGHTCAISESAGLHCWGANASGELGVAGVSSASEPTKVPLEDVSSVSAAAYSTCATTNAGELYCWGWAADGSLGDPTLIDPAIGQTSTPSLASALTGWTQVSSGETLVCGLRDGEVWCWGTSQSESGHGDGVWRRASVFAGPIATGASAVSVGPNERLDAEGLATYDHETACYLGDGAVRCWGDNRFGQLGQGAPSMSPRPLPIAGGATWTQLATGARHACGVDDEGQVRCWGSTLVGAASGTIGGTVDAPCGTIDCDLGTPKPLGPASAVAVGSDHTCALDGTAVQCWGDNAYQQLGAAPPLGPAPTPVTGEWSALFDLHGFGQCARDDLGEAYCWGNTVNTFGPPARFAELDAMTTLGLGGFVGSGSSGVGCLLDTQGQLACFGANTLGQYGNGPPALLPTCGNLLCDAGECESCPADCGGTCPSCPNAKCDFGETTASCPQDCGTGAVSRIGRTYLALGVGWDVDNFGTFVCGVRSDGGVECWGRNRRGMFGDVATVGQYLNVPNVIPRLLDCTGVAAGDAHACAICDGGSEILCWGDHRNGAVGSGPPAVEVVVEPRPVDVSLADGDRWVQIAAGVGYSCARTEKGRGFCWGHSRHGALGAGAAASTVPLVVRSQ